MLLYDSIQDAGLAKNADIVLEVKGKIVCGYCKGDIAAMAEKTGVKSVLIHANKDKTDTPISYYWESGMKSVKEVKKNEANRDGGVLFRHY